MTTPTNAFELAAQKHFGPVYGTDPVLWAKNKLNTHLWSKQGEVARSVVTNRYTAVKSCHDSGKSFDAAVLTCWWLDTHPAGEAFVVTTAPTAPQVEAILWREIEKLHSKHHLKGRITQGGFPQWKFGSEIVAYGRKPADYDQAAFQGIHARYVLVIIDEADGVPEGLFDAVDSLATNRHARVLAIGNPDNPGSHFSIVCRPGSGWNVITIDGLQSPNFTEEKVRQDAPLTYQFMVDNGIPFSTEWIPDALEDMLLSPLWVEERLKRWGVTRVEVDGEVTWACPALWQSKVRGEFPDDASEGLIPLGWIIAAQRRWSEFYERGGDESQMAGTRVYGVDVARYGGDDTVVADRQGDLLIRVERWGMQDTMTTVNRLMPRLEYLGSCVGVDVIGVGAGVVDRLRELRKRVVAFNASGRTNEKDQTGEWTFPNRRSASWWGLRERLDPANNSKVMLPPDEMLAAELSAPKWHVAAGAKIVVEEKDQTRKRLGRSPDTADAVVIAFATHGWTGTEEAAYASWAEPSQIEVDGVFSELVSNWQ